MAPEAHVKLRQWMSPNDVFLSDKIEVKKSTLGGTGVFAKQALDEDEILLRVPKDAILSAKTCGVANLLTEAEFGGLHEPLLAYLFELSQGASSPWSEFIETVESTPLPNVPRLWSPELKEKLKGTDITFMGGLDEQQLQESYEEVLPFLQEYGDYFGGEEITFSKYSEALIRVSSRVFEVDNYHGLALVPGACLLNHSDREHAHFETDGTVCQLCGALECGCVDEDSEWSDTDDEAGSDRDDSGEGEDEDSDEDEEPDGDDLENQSGDEEEWNGFSDAEDGDRKANNEADEHQDDMNDDSMEAGAEESDVENVCELRLIRTVKKGREIFNTYGEDPNSVLLARYGFAIWENANEFVDLGPELVEFVKKHKLRKQLKTWKDEFRQRVRQERDSDMSEDESAEEDDDIDDEDLFVFAVDINGDPSEALEDFATSLSPDYKLITRIIETRMKSMFDTRSSQHLHREILNKQLSEEERSIFTYVGTQKLALERAMASLQPSK